MVGRPSACRKSLLQPLLMISSVRCPGQAFVRIRGPSPHYRWLQTARSTSCGATIRTDTPWCSQRNPLTVGLTWSTPVTGGDVTWRSAFFAAVTADPAGKVNVVFLAMDDVASGTTPGPGVVFYDAYFTQSTNGGASFSSPLLISTSTSDPDGSTTNAWAPNSWGLRHGGIRRRRRKSIWCVDRLARRYSVCCSRRLSCRDHVRQDGHISGSDLILEMQIVSSLAVRRQFSRQGPPAQSRYFKCGHDS